MDSKIVGRLRSWFLANQRDMPWRENPSPYAVWVSEIMLQQTRVSVVIPYFIRWMKRFPTIEDLASASVEDVVKEWEGLGYYSRARNLHAGAKYVVENFSGELPSSQESLLQIKGLGSYTVGAIRSFAFKQKAAAVDGNVIRVLSRYYALENDIGQSKAVKEIQKHAHDLLPEKEPWVVMEALIELGATICSKKPQCVECPLREGCQGFQRGIAKELPVRAQRAKTEELYRGVAVLECCGHLLLRKGKRGKVMADLYEFPYFEISSNNFTAKACREAIEMTWGVESFWKRNLEIVQHTFTKYRATLIPHHLTVESKREIEGHRWVPFEEIQKLPFSSGHRRVLLSLESSGLLTL